MSILVRIAVAVAFPLLLAGCLFQPGKFTSTLDINNDRSFAFSYLGEIHRAEMERVAEDLPSAEENGEGTLSADTEVASKTATMSEAEKAELAETLSKEAGFRKVEYRGDDVWFVDYRIVGTLSHSFVFPFNSDAEMTFPFLAIELRANGAVRVKAPAFNGSTPRANVSGMDGGMGDTNEKIDGEFILTTDAEIISQSNEDGVVTGPDGRKTIRWRITPQSETVPMAVLRMRN